MKIYVEIVKDQDNSGFQQEIILPAPNGFKLCDHSDDADIVVVGSKAHMQELLNLEKSFLIISNEEIEGIPENVLWISADNYEKPMIKFFEDLMTEK